MIRAVHTLLHLVVAAMLMAMAVQPVVDSSPARADEVAAMTADCDKPEAETVLCGEGILPSHVRMDASFVMSAEDCEALLDAIFSNAACNPEEADCGKLKHGAPPPPSPKLLGSGAAFTLDDLDHDWLDAAASTLHATDDVLPASLVLEPPFRPPASFV